MKYLEFNDRKNDNNPKFKRAISNFNGPYIKSEPEIKVIDIDTNDEYILMGTDGLWDYMSGKDIAQILKEKKSNSLEDIKNSIFTTWMNKVSKDNNLLIEKIINMPDGSKKRSIHDDITFILFDLKNSTKH